MTIPFTIAALRNLNHEENDSYDDEECEDWGDDRVIEHEDYDPYNGGFYDREN